MSSRSDTGFLLAVLLITLLACIVCACGPIRVSGRVDVVASIDVSNLEKLLQDVCSDRPTDETRTECVDDAYRRFFNEVAQQ